MHPRPINSRNGIQPSRSIFLPPELNPNTTEVTLNSTPPVLPFRLFGIKCAKCNMGFCSSDLVMRARDSVYHMECFRCSVCCRHLLPGDEFSLREEELLCRADHCLLMERASAGSPLSPGTIHSRPLHISGIIKILIILLIIIIGIVASDSCLKNAAFKYCYSL